ncbi:alpha-N-acetylgalactosamine-specific lectin-like [Asterias rubens]|uniref:alpha-N-acetylgalactosamine-specific lectin-like n=1 Tax=Asterias rubens TaxID=7604 RepID=UPI0014558AFD|nr:alpha-N-acetylgalactosamine-specific lectin-like [Asterias rubens]
MAFWKVCFLMWQLIGLGLATDGPAPPFELREFEELRQASCPYLYQEYGNSCYRVFTNQKTQNEAEADCGLEERPSGQGHLVSILSQQENEFVTDLWYSTNPPNTGDTAWIGLSDTNGSDNIGFIWSDGNFRFYTNWVESQPIKDKKCAFLRGGFWTTEYCERKMPYICKVPL